jgi:hypothetical protein
MAATGDHLGATLFIRPPLTARRYVFWPASTTSDRTNENSRSGLE